MVGDCRIKLQMGSRAGGLTCGCGKGWEDKN